MWQDGLIGKRWNPVATIILSLSVVSVGCITGPQGVEYSQPLVRYENARTLCPNPASASGEGHEHGLVLHDGTEITVLDTWPGGVYVRYPDEERERIVYKHLECFLPEGIRVGNDGSCLLIKVSGESPFVFRGERIYVYDLQERRLVKVGW